MALFLPSAPPGVVLDFPLDASTLALHPGAEPGHGPRHRAGHGASRDGSPALREPPRRRALLDAAGPTCGCATRSWSRRWLSSLVLLIGAGLCVQGLRRARTVDLGLDAGPRAHRGPADRDERLHPGDRARLLPRGAGAARRAAGRAGGGARELVPARARRVQGLRRRRRGLHAAARRRPDLRVRDRVARATSRRCGVPLLAGREFDGGRRDVVGPRGDRQPGLRDPVLAGAGPDRAPLPHARRVAPDRRPHADREVQPARRAGVAFLLPARPAGRPRPGPRRGRARDGRPRRRWSPRFAAPCAASTPASTCCGRCRCARTSRASSSRSAWPPASCCSWAPSPPVSRRSGSTA